MARNPNAGRARRWSPPGKDTFAAVDPDAKDKAVDRSASRASPSGPGRRPNGGADVIDRRGMSQSMQKRIARARAEGERVARQQAAEREADYQRQISDLGKKVHGLTVGQKMSKEEEAHEAAMAGLEKALEKAHTDGNHADIARITREMNEKVSAWDARKRELLATPIEAPRQTQRQDGPAPEGRAWIAANGEWYGRPGYEVETTATNAIDERLLREGSNPNSPDHYRKIQKELRKKFRDINVVSPYGDDDPVRRSRDEDEDERPTRRGRQEERDDEDDEDDDERDRDDEDDDDDERDDDADDRKTDAEDEGERQQRQSRKPAFMNMEDGGESRNSRAGLKVRDGKIILSRKDRENMERFGMDPDDDKAVQQYARTKREIATSDED